MIFGLSAAIIALFLGLLAFIYLRKDNV